MADYRIIDESLKIDACLECGTLFYGRLNKRFCCDACKNRYHNRKQQEIRRVKLRMRTILERNYSILSSLLSMNLFSINRQELLLLGYNMDCMTTLCKVGRHEQCSCYDIAFYRTQTRIYNIHRVSYPSKECPEDDSF